MEQKEKKDTCCASNKNNPSKGLLAGIAYGLVPHSFCIAFAIFSIIGSVAATAFLKKFLLIPNIFSILVVLSFVLATISAFIYLKKNNCLCVDGLKNKWKYITILYSSTILVNLFIFFVLIPTLINAAPQKSSVENNQLSNLSLDVKIPCSGHAALIIDELKKNAAIETVRYDLPEKFEIKYDAKKTSPEKIIGLEIFKEYPATIIN